MTLVFADFYFYFIRIVTFVGMTKMCDFDYLNFVSFLYYLILNRALESPLSISVQIHTYLQKSNTVELVLI